MGFTDEQKEAIICLDNNFIVSAGAGSGKTTVLSEKVLYLVKDKHYKLSDMLILTFTNLAAAEMKERIRKKLSEQGLEEALNVDTADICTFDSYSLSLVKKYHQQLKVNQNVSIVDSSIVDVKRREIINQVFNEFYEQKDSDFIELIKNYCFKNDDDLQNIVFSMLKKVSLEEDEEAYIDSLDQRFFEDDYINSRIDELFAIEKQRVEELLSLAYDLSSEKNLSTIAVDDLKNILKMNFDDFIIHMKSFSLPRVVLKDEEEKMYRKIFNSEKDKIKKEIDKIGLRKEVLDSEKALKPHVTVLKKITKIVHQRIKQFKEEHQAFEFFDIAKMALRLIRNNDEIRNQIKNNLKIIMIDEYQDTSSLQESFIKEISNKNVYMVGDIKQSIYRFRNANPDIFMEKYKNYKSHIDGKKIDLNKNFRSRKEVLEDINDIFSKIMTLDYGGADYKKDHMIQFGNTFLYGDSLNQNNHIDYIVYDNKINSSRKMEFEAKLIAEDIIKKINNHYQVIQVQDSVVSSRNVRFSDFCIIMDRGTQFDIVQKVFSEYQIPVFIEADSNIIENNLIKVLKSLLILVNDIYDNNCLEPRFKHAYVSVARSFLYQYDDEFIYRSIIDETYLSSQLIESLKKFVSKNQNESLSEMIMNLYFDLDIYSKLITIGDIKKNEIYLDNLYSTLKNMDKLHYCLNDFILYLDHLSEYNLKFNISSQKEDIDTVRMMNIHKSKGLEFNIIYYAGLSKAFPQPNNSVKYSASNQFGFLLPIDGNKNIFDIINSKKENKLDISEKIRLLYVALTRAKEKAILVLPYKEEGNIESATCLEDFIVPFIKRDKILNIDDIKNSHLNESNNDIEKPTLRYIPISFNFEKSESNRASKELSFQSYESALEYGTKIHYYLELLDFKNPDFSIVEDYKVKKYIERFLNQELIKKLVTSYHLYKEYQFYDEIEDNEGSIDLLAVKEDIYIIDYKLKNITAEAYIKQIKTYARYIERVFDKKVYGYLVSLIDGSIQEVL